MKTIQIPIEIRIPFAYQTSKSAIAKIIKEQATDYTILLCKGLGISTKVTVKVEISKDETDQWFGLRIGGQAARVRYLNGLPNHFQNILPLGTGICEEICRNRTLFVTPEVLEFAATIAHERFQQFTPPDQHTIVSSLFHLGFGLERLKQFSGALEDQANPLAFVENCLADLEITSVCMFACAAEIEPDDDPYDFNRLVEALQDATNESFKQTGIPFPAVKTEIQQDLESGHIFFRFNDLFLPKRKLEGVQAQYAYLISQFKEYGYFFINRGSVLFLLESLETANPNLLAIFRAKFTTDTLVQVLRQLAQERLSIRTLVRILEIMVGGDDTYVVPIKKWFPTPITENILFLGEEKPWAELTASDWADFVRMYYKSGLRNLALNHGDSTDPSLVKSALAVNLHDFCKNLKVSKGVERATHLRNLHKKLAEMIPEDFDPQNERWFCINALSSYRRILQEAIQYEFPEVAVFSNQELVLINLSPDSSHTLSL